jgi:hypothetical protein
LGQETEIVIRDLDDSVPNLGTFDGIYDGNTNMLKWNNAGLNSLMFSGGGFTGTITQNVIVP